MCSSGSALPLTCAGHCPSQCATDKAGGCSPKLLWCQTQKEGLANILPLLPSAFLFEHLSLLPSNFMVLCGYSFNLTSAYLWTKLLMAFSSLRHGRWWQSKWAQGLGASSSKHCLHLEPGTKATVMGTCPFALVHFASGKLDTVQEKKCEWKCLKNVYIFLRNRWPGNAEQSLRKMIAPASIWVQMKWWGWEDAGKALLRCRGLPGTGRLANRSNSLSRRALLCLKPLLWSLQDRSALAPDLESGNLMGFLFLDLSSEALLSWSIFS